MHCLAAGAWRASWQVFELPDFQGQPALGSLEGDSRDLRQPPGRLGSKPDIFPTHASYSFRNFRTF